MDDRHWVLWDGDCDFCRRWAGWLAARDTRGRLRIVPYQEAPEPPATPQLRAEAARAVQVVTSEGERLSGGEAILFALRHTDWHPQVARMLMRRPFLWGVEAGYWVAARNRGRLSRFWRDSG
jgi:predicted DCC family thiol-disulfide oxidoreductase YuxK